MNPNEYNDIMNSLVEAKLIDNNDKLIVTENGDYWEKFLFFRSQVRGYYYFTEKRIVFIGGFASTTQLSIQYKDIKKIEKCSVGPFLPFGVMIYVYDENKNKIIKYKLSLQNRNRWITFIENRIKGVNN